MASGRAHDRATLIVSAPLGLCMATLGGIDAGLVAAAACSFGGLWLSPDLDTHSNALRRWGALRGLWWPYRRLIPHRSLWSHGPLIGMALRLLWLLSCGLLGWLLLQELLQSPWSCRFIVGMILHIVPAIPDHLQLLDPSKNHVQWLDHKSGGSTW